MSGWWPALLGRLRPGQGALAVEAALPLDARRRLCLVRCEGRRVLLLIGGGNDLLVGWLDPAPPAAEPPP